MDINNLDITADLMAMDINLKWAEYTTFLTCYLNLVCINATGIWSTNANVLPKCMGTGYRMKKGRTKRCKCIKEQAKRMGKRRDFSSSYIMDIEGRKANGNTGNTIFIHLS